MADAGPTEVVSTSEPADDPAAGQRSVPPSLGYQPGLDGLRGLALLAILAFHAGFDWAPGAFLSVSTFFTLSGFLITYLLLREFGSQGRVDRRAFWSRRIRRLLPASLVAIGGVVLAAAVLASPTQLARLRGDVVASLAYVANWRFVLQGDEYGALFTTRSPMQHFWSLAIEEQFYVLFPLLLIAVLAASRGSRRVVTGVLVAIMAATFLLGTVLLAGGASIDRLYFGTDFRAPELLIGALLAVWWTDRGRIGGWMSTPRGERSVRAAGAVAVVVALLLWYSADRTDLVWYRGGLLVYALVTCVIIVAALEPSGPVRRVLSTRLMVAIGLVSYGAYLLHWPVFVWVDERTGLAPWPLFALRLAITFALAVLSYFVVERPIRSGAGSLRTVLIGSAGVIAAILGGVWLITAGAQSTEIDFAAARDRFGDQAAPEALVEPGVETMDDVYRQLHEQPDKSGSRAAVFGDSTALMVGLGLDAWTLENGDTLRSALGWADLGCATVPAERRVVDTVEPYPEHCEDWVDEWRAAAQRESPDVAVVSLGPWEVADTRLPGSDDWRSLGDPELDAEVRAALEDGVDALLEHAPSVVLLTSPPIEPGRADGRSPPEPAPESDPRRMERWNQMLIDVAEERDAVGIVDLAGFIAEQGERDLVLRPDGIHLTETTTHEAASWLGPEIARAAAALPAR